MNNIKDTAIDVYKKWTQGRQLKRDLGLENFKYAYIQKIIDMAQNVYIVSVDSRYPNVFFGFTKLKKIKSVTIQKTKRTPFEYKFKNYKLTPPILLDEFKGDISSNAMIIRQDLTGDYFMNDKMYESVVCNKKVKII